MNLQTKNTRLAQRIVLIVDDNEDRAAQLRREFIDSQMGLIHGNLDAPDLIPGGGITEVSNGAWGIGLSPFQYRQ